MIRKEMPKIKQNNFSQEVDPDLCKEHGGETETCDVDGSLDGAGGTGECWVWAGRS